MGFDDLHKKRQGNLRKRKAENEDIMLLGLMKLLNYGFYFILNLLVLEFQKNNTLIN